VNEQLLQAMEAAAQTVAAYTGVKQQFVDSGWSEHNAELAVIALIYQSGRGGK